MHVLLIQIMFHPDVLHNLLLVRRPIAAYGIWRANKERIDPTEPCDVE